jgi:hypothetical protein
MNEFASALFNENHDWKTKLDIIWHIYRFVSLIPLILFTLHRFRKQLPNEEYYDKSKNFPRSKIDSFTKMYSFFSLCYYIFQHFVVGMLLKNNSKQDFFKNMISIYGFWDFINIEYFPWFTLILLTFDSIVYIMGNHSKILNFFYLISILLCYYGLSNKPYQGRKNYNRIRLYLVLLIISLVITRIIKF